MTYTTDLIIVNFNTKAYLAACIESIRAHTLPPDYRLTIVDNASTDGSIEYIRTLPGITAVFNAKNTGYATACNLGIKEGNGKFIFLLNSDLVMTPGWLPPLLKTLSDPEVAVVGPRLVNPEGFLVGVGVVGTVEHPVLRGWAEPDEPHRYAEYTDCISVCGACLGIKRELLPELGYFDENYFHYFEETDYCYNARLHGYKVVYCPESKVIHRYNGSCRNQRRLREYFKQSEAYFREKWHLPPAGSLTSLCTGRPSPAGDNLR